MGRVETSFSMATRARVGGHYLAVSRLASHEAQTPFPNSYRCNLGACWGLAWRVLTDRVDGGFSAQADRRRANWKSKCSLSASACRLGVCAAFRLGTRP